MKIWFQNRRMKWRNSKERELIAHGGCREQTLPTKHNPNPDLSDPASPSAVSQHSKQTSNPSDQSSSNNMNSNQHQMPTLTSKSSALSYLGLPTQNSLIHPSQHHSIAAAGLPWATHTSSVSSDFSSVLKRGNLGNSQSIHSEIGGPMDSVMRGVGCDSIDGEDDEDIDEDIEVDDVEESEDDDKDQDDEAKSDNTYVSIKKGIVDDNETHSDNDIQVA